MTSESMDNKILRAYKNWGIGQVVTILRRQGYKLNEKKVREVLAKNKVKIREAGHNWRHSVVSGFSKYR